MNQFELQSTNITKELLLSRNSQERYFEHYLGIPVKKGLFVCPPSLRVDHRPTCSFYKTAKGVLILNDFAGESYDFISVVMHLFKCTYYKALRIIANDFGIIKLPDVEINKPKIEYTDSIISPEKSCTIQVKIKDFSAKELAWWDSFGISKSILAKFKVFSIQHVFLNGNYFTTSSETTPIFGYYGGVNSKNEELWRLYFPTKTKYRFISNWKNIHIQGAKQLKNKSNSCIITKSLKDVMCLTEFGFEAIAPNSENNVLSENQINKLKKNYNLFMFFDNDLAGVHGANKYKKLFGISCIFIKRKYSKDITDLYKSVSHNVFWTIIDELQQLIKDNTINQTKHFYIFRYDKHEGVKTAQ